MNEKGFVLMKARSRRTDIIHLRGFKSFRERHATEPVNSWRFYLELAPYGDLDGLIRRYRYYNQFLPESFLWHVAHSLLEGAEVMMQCSRDEIPLRSTPLNDTDEVVNFDIKTVNVFLGYAERRKNASRRGGTTRYDYPTIKLGDFGMAFFTGEDDHDNPCLYFAHGTRHCRPPVSAHPFLAKSSC